MKPSALMRLKRSYERRGSSVDPTASGVWRAIKKLPKNERVELERRVVKSAMDRLTAEPVSD